MLRFTPFRSLKTLTNLKFSTTLLSSVIVRRNSFVVWNGRLAYQTTNGRTSKLPVWMILLGAPMIVNGKKIKCSRCGEYISETEYYINPILGSIRLCSICFSKEVGSDVIVSAVSEKAGKAFKSETAREIFRKTAEEFKNADSMQLLQLLQDLDLDVTTDDEGYTLGEEARKKVQKEATKLLATKCAEAFVEESAGDFLAPGVGTLVGGVFDAVDIEEKYQKGQISKSKRNKEHVINGLGTALGTEVAVIAGMTYCSGTLGFGPFAIFAYPACVATSAVLAKEGTKQVFEIVD